MRNQSDVSRLVYTPAELGNAHLRFAEKIAKEPGIQFGIPAIDKKVLPQRGGDLTCLLARPGHAKTSLMAYLARTEAQRIIERGTNDGRECVIYVSWEERAEILEAYFQTDGAYSVSDLLWGRVDLDLVRKRAVKRAGLPIWMIGHGIGRAGKRVPRMTPDKVLEAIASMERDFDGIRPTLLLFDYLQLVPVPKGSNRTEQVTEATIGIKQLAVYLGVPAVAGVQARREVDRRDIKIPQKDDAQHSSAIEQTMDKGFGLWRPVLTESSANGGHAEVRLNGSTYEANERLLIMQMVKQRGEAGRHTWAMYFAPEYLQLAELETAQARD